jgi:ADP-heptose:LPS heptosyltransferase
MKIENIKIIAVINLGYIGDVVNASPVCIELKNKYPDSKLIFITMKPAMETAKCLPGVDEIIVYDRRGEHKGLKNLIKLSFSIRKKYEIDLAILLTDSFRSAFFTYLLGANKRLGRACQGRSIFLNYTIPHFQEEKEMKIHVSEHYMRLLKPLNLYKQDYKLNFKYSKEDTEYIETSLKVLGYKGERLIGICPCARLEGKNWWPEDTVEFINLINKEKIYKVVLVGDNSAKPFVEKLKELNCDNFYDMSGKTNISQLAAIIAKCSNFVSVDTGSMHIAFALSIPTIALFYYDCVTKWGPKDQIKNKVILNPDRHGIKAQEVFDKMHELQLLKG